MHHQEIIAAMVANLTQKHKKEDRLASSATTIRRVLSPVHTPLRLIAFN